MSKVSSSAFTAVDPTYAPSQSLPPAVALVLAIILFGVALRIYYFDSSLSRSPDERTYIHQANVILTQGMAGLAPLGQQLKQNPALLSQAPSPARVGYLTVLASFMELTGDTSALAGAQFSLLCSIAALSLLAFTTYRAFSPTISVVATLFYSVLPFDLTTSRRAWQDSFISLLALVIISVAIFIARSSSARRVAGFTAFTLLGVLAITTKENFAVFFMLCAAGLTVHFILKHDRRNAIATSACAAAAGIASLAILVSLFGGLANYFAMERAFAHYSNLGPYDLEFNTGPAWMFPAAFFRTSPVLVLAAIAGFTISIHGTIRSRKLSGSGAALGVALISLSMVLIQILTARYNFRYTAPVYGSICILVGIGIEASLSPLNKLMAPLGRWLAWAVIGFALSVCALHDLNVARDRFLLPGVQDLALRVVLGVPPAPLPVELPR
jgi:hypothetical protein